MRERTCAWRSVLVHLAGFVPRGGDQGKSAKCSARSMRSPAGAARQTSSSASGRTWPALARARPARYPPWAWAGAANPGRRKPQAAHSTRPAQRSRTRAIGHAAVGPPAASAPCSTSCPRRPMAQPCHARALAMERLGERRPRGLTRIKPPARGTPAGQAEACNAARSPRHPRPAWRRKHHPPARLDLTRKRSAQRCAGAGAAAIFACARAAASALRPRHALHPGCPCTGRRSHAEPARNRDADGTGPSTAASRHGSRGHSCAGRAPPVQLDAQAPAQRIQLTHEGLRLLQAVRSRRAAPDAAARWLA